MRDPSHEQRWRRVLLADPDEARRHATALQLRLGGYGVVEVAAIREIPEAARDGIDVLVSEAQLLDGSAVTYATYLRRGGRTASLPVLIATYDREAASAAARTLGERSALHLPVAPSALLDRIGELLASSAR